MSCRSTLLTLGLVALTGLGVTAQAQTSAERTFNLKRKAIADTTASQEVQKEKTRYVPRLSPGQLECSLTLGYVDLGATLISHPERLIYKRSDEYTYYGDVELVGEQAFNPILRIGYVLKPWLAIEGLGGFSVSEYSTKISQTVRIANEGTADQREYNIPLEEFDMEQRSFITLNGGARLLYYPLDHGEGMPSRWHPFLLGGLSRTLFSINSNYTDEGALSTTLTGGGGIRFIADNLISVRMEILYSRSTVKFDPAENFLSLNEGTLLIPVLALPEIGPPKSVEEFGEQDVSSLSWAFGFTASF